MISTSCTTRCVNAHKRWPADAFTNQVYSSEVAICEFVDEGNLLRRKFDHPYASVVRFSNKVI